MRRSYRRRPSPERPTDDLPLIVPLVVVLAALAFLAWLAWQMVSYPGK